MTSATDRQLTVEQAATQAGVHPEPIRRAYRTGELRGRRNRLAPGGPLIFAQSDVTAFIKARMGLD